MASAFTNDFAGPAISGKLEFVPPDPYEAPPEQSADRAPATLRLADLALMANTPPEPRAFLVEKFIPRHELTLVTGPGGVAKSLFGQQLCTAVAAGMPMLGLGTARCRTLYVTAEDDERELHWRQDHIARRLAVPIDLEGLHMASIRGRLGNALCSFDDRGRIHPSTTFDALTATIKRTGAGLVVLDNAAHLFAGNENDRAHVTLFCNLLYRLVNECAATLLLIAHPNKTGDSYSGSTAWLNAVRSHVCISFAPPQEADPDGRVLSIGEKANYGRRDAKVAFRWHDFALARDEDLPSDTGRNLAKIAADAAINAIFLACLDEMTRRKVTVSESSGRNFAPIRFSEMCQAKGATKRDLAAAMERLFQNGSIERGELPWKTNDRKSAIGLRRTPRPENQP